jgi:hypothetical protein
MKGHASGVSRRATGDGSARPKLLRTTPGCTQLDRHTNTVWSPSASCWAFTMSRRHGVDGLDDLDGGEGALQPPGELVCSRTVKDLVAGPALRSPTAAPSGSKASPTTGSRMRWGSFGAAIRGTLGP